MTETRRQGDAHGQPYTHRDTLKRGRKARHREIERGGGRRKEGSKERKIESKENTYHWWRL